MNWLWVNGWGVEVDALQSWANLAFPGISHSVIRPARIEPLGRDFDRIIGWSWGAYRLLEGLVNIPGFQRTATISLVAPFLGFCREDQLGGKCSRIQVKYLQRWLDRDPEQALKDFYQRAGLSFPIPSRQSGQLGFWASELRAMSREKMDLQKVKKAFATTNVQILVGEKDPLVDESWLVKNLCAISCGDLGHDVSNFSYLLK